jgi:hypothetical protein
MDRVLGWSVNVFVGLAVAHWVSVDRMLRTPGLWCGNVISDPLLLLLNSVGPVVGVCVALLVWRRITQKRRPFLPLTTLPVYLGTMSALAYELIWLSDYGFPLSHAVRWLPWL